MAMFDLNFEINHVDVDVELSSAQKGVQLENFPLEISDYRTSNSSVFNPAEADSSNNSSPLVFDILKRESHGSKFYVSAAIGRNMGQEEKHIVTRNFFPVTTIGADKEDRVPDFNSGLWGKTQWLNLSFPEPEGQIEILQQKLPHVRKNRRGPRSRSSQYRGVTFYRRTGGFDTAQAAARAYDRAAIKFRGVDADINFSLSDYEEDMKQMKSLSKEEVVLLLRRQMSGISRRSSAYRGVVALGIDGKGEPRTRPLLSNTFYPKPTIKCDEGKVGGTFKPFSYKEEKIADSTVTGTSHNLDLSLGISPSSKRVKNNDYGGFSFGYMASKIPSERGIMEKATIDTVRNVPLQKNSNLAWQLCSNGSIATKPLQLNAASSGFVSSSTCLITHSIPIITHINCSNNLACLNHSAHH